MLVSQFFWPSFLAWSPLWYSIVLTSVTKSVTRQIISSKFNKFLLRLMLQSFLYMKNTKQQGFIEIRTSYLNRQCPYVMVSFRGYLFSWFKGKGRCKLSYASYIDQVRQDICKSSRTFNHETGSLYTRVPLYKLRSVFLQIQFGSLAFAAVELPNGWIEK